MINLKLKIMQEIWKSIPGFSRYEASNTGKLRSLLYKNGKRTQELKPALSGGYLKTMLRNDNYEYKSWNVHKFITLAFFGKCPDKLQVNHKDGNKLNNNISNLEYITHKENCQHAYDNGLSKIMHGSRNGMAKLTEKDVIEIREYVKNFKGRYYGRKELAKKYGVSEAHIKDIVTKRRNTWKYV